MNHTIKKMNYKIKSYVVETDADAELVVVISTVLEEHIIDKSMLTRAEKVFCKV